MLYSQLYDVYNLGDVVKMYDLNTQEVQSVAGGYSVYVTEEWKQTEANGYGAVYGTLGAIVGGIVGGTAASLPGAVLGVLAGGTSGYYFGYGVSRLENSVLENNTWYDINYYVVYY